MTVRPQPQSSAAQATPLKVMIVDDAPSTRRFLSALINSVEEFDLVEESGNGREAIEAAKLLQPDVVLLDLLLPDMDGSKVLDEILRVAGEAKVVILSNNAKRAGPALTDAGAAGFIEKGITPDDLLRRLSLILEISIDCESVTSDGDRVPRCAVIFDTDALTRFQMSSVLRNSGFHVVSEIADVADAGEYMRTFVCATQPTIFIFGEGGVTPQILAQIKRESPRTLLVAYTVEAIPLSIAGIETFRLVVPPDMDGLTQSVRELMASARSEPLNYRVVPESARRQAPLGSYFVGAGAHE